jgi:hypothetical protein
MGSETIWGPDPDKSCQLQGADFTYREARLSGAIRFYRSSQFADVGFQERPSTVADRLFPLGIEWP